MLLPSHVLEKMSAADRKELGKAGRLASECIEKAQARSERAAQRTFASWLGLRGIYFIQARADKRSTIRVGHPDFTVLHAGRVLVLEMKAEGGRLSEEQEKSISALLDQGFKVSLVYSALEAITTTKEFFEI